MQRRKEEEDVGVKVITEHINITMDDDATARKKIEQNERKRRKIEDDNNSNSYNYQSYWIHLMVKNKKTWAQMENGRGYNNDNLTNLYYWEYAVVSSARELTLDVMPYPQLNWEYRLFARLNTKQQLFKCILAVKKSRVNRNCFGLFAKCRFKVGDPITVLIDPELNIVYRRKQGKSGGERLALGGSCALDAKYNPRSKCNAILAEHGVIRASREIVTDEEITVDFDRTNFHPVMYLDALVWRWQKNSSTQPRIAARVDHYKRDGKGGIKYYVKMSTGKVEEVSMDELVNNLVKKKNYHG